MNETAYSLHKKLNVLLERSYEGQAAVAILGGILKMMYKEASIVVHPANESGASSLEVGDIDIIFSNDRCYAVEVKDKAFSETDVDHAAKKVLGKGRSRLIFACGYHGDISCIDIPGMIDKWRHNGVELSFVSIPLLFHQNLSLFGAEECHQYLNHVWSILITMRAKDEAVQDFMALLSLEGQ